MTPMYPQEKGLAQLGGMMPSKEMPPAIAQQQLYPEGFTFQDLQSKVKNLKKQWEPRIEKCRKNRLLRNMQIDNEEYRQRGNFKPDEIYIPYHVIGDNISKESASYIKFITGSRNAGIFKIRNNPAVVNFEPLERVFTSAVRYEGHEQELFPLIDGHQLHGTDTLEVKYEPSRPGYFEFEQVGFENFWYPLKLQRAKLQSSPILVKNCEVTKDELNSIPDIDKAQVELLFPDSKDNDAEKDFTCIQKVYYRVNGTVHICWMNVEKNTNFLRVPKPLHMGRVSIVKDEMTQQVISTTPIYEKIYPFVVFPYSIHENKQLCETLGRAALDENTQEAVSSLVSHIINAYHRAAQTFWSPKNPTSATEIAQLELVLENGRGLNQPIDFFSHPYPDASGMELVNALLTQNKSETTQINFAVGNRSDYASRKTAKEVDVADKQQNELSTTQVVLFSSSWTEVLNIAYLIFKGQVELGTIQIEGMNASVLQEDLILQSAGITEVMQRQETLMNLQNLWPVVQATPAAMVVLEEIVRLMVPTLADKIIASLGMVNDKQLIAAFVQIITAIAKDHPEVIPPESYEQLGGLLQAAQQSIMQGQPQNGTEQPKQQAGQPAPAAST